MDTVCIIVNYNDADNTLSQINRIRDYSNIDKIIVVDNASTDDSYLRLRDCICDKLAVLKAPKNGGYGYGNNLGIRYAKNLKASYALIANPDTEFSEDTVEKLKARLMSDAMLAAIAPFMYTPVLNDKINKPGSRENVLHGAGAWPLRGWGRDLLESGPISRRLFYKFLHYDEEYFKSSDMLYVDALAGAFLMVDIDKFIEAGGYDERVFLYAEENILAYRLKRKNYKSALLSSSFYIHRHSQSIKKSFSSIISRQRLREESTLYYYRRYLGIGKIKYAISRLFFKLIELELIVFGIIFRGRL